MTCVSGPSPPNYRQRIIDAATQLGLERWYDEISLEIAAKAGVALQTIVNHFGTKEAIYAATLEQPIPAELVTRLTAEPGDVATAVALLVQDYEHGGDAIIRALALEGRFQACGRFSIAGEAEHREWVDKVRRDCGPEGNRPAAAPGPARLRHLRLHLESAARPRLQPGADRRCNPRAGGGAAQDERVTAIRTRRSRCKKKGHVLLLCQGKHRFVTCESSDTNSSLTRVRSPAASDCRTGGSYPKHQR